MSTEKLSTSEFLPAIRSLRLLVILAFVVVAGAAAFAFLVLHKLNRVVVVVENANAQVNRVVAAAAPLGKATVEKGVKALDAVDTDDLGKSATEGVKEIGRSAKEKAIELIRQRRADAERKSE
jgi:uncharacterized membrane protein